MNIYFLTFILLHAIAIILQMIHVIKHMSRYAKLKKMRLRSISEWMNSMIRVRITMTRSSWNLALSVMAEIISFSLLWMAGMFDCL